MYKKYRFRFLFFSDVIFAALLFFPMMPYQLELAGFMLFIGAAFIILRNSQWFILAMILGIFNLFVYILLFFVQLDSTLPVYFLRNIPLILLYIIISISIFKYVINQRPVTDELLYGLGAIYLQTALIFAFTFDVIERLLPGSFTTSSGAIHFDILVYYSIVTITTVGYGDVQATGALARLLSCTEGVFGVLFLALIVTKIMSLLNQDTE